MPSKIPFLGSAASQQLIEIGERIRAHRKLLAISATAAAESSGISRVTLHRIEAGLPSVTIGAYICTMQALGLKISVQEFEPGAQVQNTDDQTHLGWIPVAIPLNEYPELRRLAWHIYGAQTLTPSEALGIYERNVRHLDVSALTAKESALIDGLRLVFSKAGQHV